MPLIFVRNDITKMNVDAIVNAANNSLLGGGGVDGCIHRAAGKELLEECRKLGGCNTGCSKITSAYKLPCKYVIHTVGPIWRGGNDGEKELLISCYSSSLELARKYGCESIAFPLISSGVYGYPKDKALKVAMDTVRDFLFDNDMLVYLVIFDESSMSISEKLFSNIAQYIDSNYVLAHSDAKEQMLRRGRIAYESCVDNYGDHSILSDISEIFDNTEDTFSNMLIKKIDERGMTDSECYKKANIDRKLFSKIRNNKNYKPSKSTVLSFSVALELPYEETVNFLKCAGFAFSRSDKFDLIIEYFIKNKNYNIYEINEALFSFEQPLLGSLK